MLMSAGHDNPTDVMLSGKAAITAAASVSSSLVAGGSISSRVTDADYKDLAFNLGNINYWAPFWPFADALKMESRGWMSGGGQSNLPVLMDTSKTWTLDAKGYVKTPGTYNAKPYQNSFATTPSNSSRRAPVGRYVVTWVGEGDINIYGGTVSLLSNTTDANGVHRKEYNLTAGYPGIVVTNLADGTAGGTYVQDIHIWMPDYLDPQNKSLAPAAGAPLPLWNPEYLNLLQSVAANTGYLRFMDWIDTNSSPVTKWADNRPADYAFAAGNTSWKLLNVPGISDTTIYGGIGVPWEYIIDLSNRLNVNPWINIPHAVDWDAATASTQGDYVQNLADLFAGKVAGKDGLKAGLKLYVEYSNEIWSAGTEFAQGDWANTQSGVYRTVKNLPTSVVYGKPEFNGMRTADFHYIFDQAFKTAKTTGGTTVDRTTDIIRVAGAFSGQVYYNEHYLTQYNTRGKALNGNVDFFADVMAATTYFGNSPLIKYIFNDTSWLSANLANAGDAEFKAVFDWWVQNSLSTNAFTNSTNWTTARKFNLSYLAYEGGPSLYTESVPVYIKDGKIVDTTTTGATRTFSLSSYVKQNFADDTPADKNDPDRFTKLLMAMNQHPRMEEVYRAQLQQAKARGLKTHAAFNDVNEWTKFGQWGSLAYLDQPQGYGYGQAVKWQTLKDWANEEAAVKNVDNVTGIAPVLPANGALPIAKTGTAYSTTITASSHGNGAGSVLNWKRVAGYMPPGLDINFIDADHATITGTPTTTGSYKFMVRLVDSDGDPAYAVYSIDVAGTNTGGGGGGTDPDPGTVTPGGGTFTATEDTYATQNTSTTSANALNNEGNETYIMAGTGLRSGFLKFDLRNKIVPGTPIDSVYLRVFVNKIEGNSAGTNRTIWLEDVTDNVKDGSKAWTEDNMDYQSAPTSGTTLTNSTKSLSATPSGWYQFDVTSYVKANLEAGLGGTGDGIISFAVRARVVGGDNTFVGLMLASKEYGSGTRAPQLTINQSADPTPVRGDIAPIIPADRTTPVTAATVTFTTPVAGFDATDLTLSRNGAIINMSGVTITTADNKVFTINGLTANNSASGAYILTLKSTGTGITELTNATNTLTSGDAEPWSVLLPGSVLNRYAFYNNSYFDGNDATANVKDDLAIATNKTALRPGQTATLANITNYSKGINGIIIDITDLKFSELTASDLAFKVGNSNDPTSWTALTTMPEISIRHGVGTSNTDRVTLIWPDGLIKKQWLQVTVKATENTGLAADDVFYFGNAIGEAADNPANAAVTAADASKIVNNYSGLGLVSVVNLYDINRDGRSNSTDYSLAVNNYSGLTPLQLITVP